VSKEFKLNTHDLPRRAGEMKEYHLAIKLENPIGIDVIAVPAGTLNLDLRLESVAEGILATGDFDVVAKGECIRCLDPIDLTLERNFQELYSYKPDPEIEEEDQLLMDGDILDLEAPIRDAIVLALPINPLCEEDCEGLCSECGEKWRELPEDHAHQQIDARWGALAGLLDENKPQDSNEK
jgi:uncharacterized protein